MSNDENELYYDYYGFSKEMYEITWKSRGSHELAEKIVGLFKKVLVNYFFIFIAVISSFFREFRSLLFQLNFAFRAIFPPKLSIISEALTMGCSFPSK